MMSRAEAKYKYLVNEEKYDPEVRKAVSKKSISHSDANKINAMQEMMRKEREERGTRNIITSENRADFMAKKLGLNKEDSQDMPSTKYVVKYHNSKGEQDSGEKHFDDEEKAIQHAEKGNKKDKVGGKYSVHKIRIK